jgi:hypothetical protein
MSLVKNKKVMDFFEMPFTHASGVHIKDPSKGCQFIIRESQMNQQDNTINISDVDFGEVKI